MNRLTIETRDLTGAHYECGFWVDTGHFFIRVKFEPVEKYGIPADFAGHGRSRYMAAFHLRGMVRAAENALAAFGGDDGGRLDMLVDILDGLNYPVVEPMTDGAFDCVLTAQAAA